MRFSIKNPQKYFNSNILGFFNLIEASRKYKIKKVVSASTAVFMVKIKNYLLKKWIELII